MEKCKKKGLKNQASIVEITESDLEGYIKNSLFEQIITLGIDSYLELIEEEITELCGTRYRHMAGRELTRWSKVETPVIFGGRKVSIPHTRVRDIKNNKEKDLKIIEKYKDKKLLSHRQMQQMIIGVSTRKYKRSLETNSAKLKTSCDSKSTVSRNFIAMTWAKLEAWRNEPINNFYPIVMIDGIVYKKTTVILALGIDKEGKKKALGAWEGSTENSRVCIDLLQNLIERGLDASNIKLAVIDGSKALRKALDEVLGKEILIQRCQIHKKKNVVDYLPENMKEIIKRAMDEAYNADSYETAKRLLQNIIKNLEKSYPQAARSLGEGLEETLTLHKLKAHKKIRKSLASTNPIESLNSGIKGITRRVKRWRNSDMVIRWVCTGITESERNFKKINGYVHLDALLKNIGTMKKKVLDAESGAA